jgi:hypothetical protein
MTYHLADESAAVPAAVCVKWSRRIVITCGDWDPEKLLKRLHDGGCPNRFIEWVYYPRSNTIQGEAEMTKDGHKAVMDWLRKPYVIPTELTIQSI